MLHSRLRTGCSSLNHDLFTKGISETPLCRCGEIETTAHHFLSCQLHQNQRVALNTVISNYTQITLQTILYGSNILSLNENNAIVEAVHTYIKESNRF